MLCSSSDIVYEGDFKIGDHDSELRIFYLKFTFHLNL